MERIGRQTRMLLACDICHGSGLTSSYYSGDDVRCHGCEGAGQLSVPIGGLTAADLELLSLVSCAELTERYARPVGAVGS